MKSLTKKEALRIIHHSALAYKENLSGKTIMFITDEPDYYETLFLPQNFLHLTGIQTDLKCIDFFNNAIRDRISEKDITIAKDGTTDKKLCILQSLMRIHLTAKMIGDYDNSGRVLVADKLVGTVTVAMSLKKANGIYVPQSSIKDDIRNITTKASRHRVIAILEKSRKSTFYTDMSYLAKGVTLDNPSLVKLLKNKYTRFQI